MKRCHYKSHMWRFVTLNMLTSEFVTYNNKRLSLRITTVDRLTSKSVESISNLPWFWLYALWLVSITRAAFSTNEKENKNQPWLARTRFTALYASYIGTYLLWILISSLHCLVKEIALALHLRRSLETALYSLLSILFIVWFVRLLAFYFSLDPARVANILESFCVDFHFSNSHWK